MEYAIQLKNTPATFVFTLMLIGFSALAESDNDTSASEEWGTSPQVLSEIKRLEAVYPEQSGKIRWGDTGHQYTTYIVAMAAGLGRARSHELAFYSQYPDDEIQFSATLAFFNIFDLEHRKRIMSTLHSLHGGEHDAVEKRRRDLQQLISDGMKSGKLNDRQIGLIVHALGDSYAHTTGDVDNSDLKAFDHVFGHLFHGTEPDIIAYNPQKYRRYMPARYMRH